MRLAFKAPSSDRGAVLAVGDLRWRTDAAPVAPQAPIARPGVMTARGALLVAACGVLLISLAYAAGRSGRSWAEALFWCGDLMVFLPLAAVVLAPRARHRAAIVLAQAAFQALIAWMYSPLAFRFPDELQHYRTAEDILQRHALFHPSTALPVSPRFPGLEEITTALVSVTHLDIYAAGLVVAGLAHVGLAAAVFLLFKTVTRDERFAAVAALIFGINPHHAFFNTFFIYEAPALLFMAVALQISVRRTFRLTRELPLAVLSLAAVCVTHHVTAAMTALILLAIGVLVGVRRPLRRHGARFVALGALGAGMLVAWVVGVAPLTYQYLAGPLGSALDGLLSAGSTAGTDPVGVDSSPIVTAFTVLGTVTMAILVARGVALTWRRPTQPVLRAMVWLSLSFFAVLGVRLFATDGAELAGRLLTYVYLFAAAAAAFALTHLWTVGRRRAGVLALAALTAVFVGNVTSGWPAPYEIVPGKFRVDAFESGVDPANQAAAQWISAHAPGDATVACDVSLCSLVGGYGTQRALNNVAGIFYPPTVDRSVRRLLSEYEIDFVMVDERMGRQRPTGGSSYFDHDPAAASRPAPIPRRSLDKFDAAPGVSRVFQNGPVAIYDVRTLRHG